MPNEKSLDIQNRFLALHFDRGLSSQSHCGASSLTLRILDLLIHASGQTRV
jgi:hypothetical protein